MECEIMLMTWRFKFPIRKSLVFSVYAVGLLQLCPAQAPQNIEGAKSILQLSEAEQVDFVKSVLDQHFPDAQGDRFSILLVNRTQLVVPLIESRIEEELRGTPRSESFIDLASAMISYAGDEQALQAVNQLIQIDPKRFGAFVGRTLDSASNWRNPFDVAYRGLEMGDTISGEIGTWAESVLSLRKMQRFWAESMLGRYGKVPSESEWTSDPIAARMKSHRPENLQESVVELAKEAAARRDKRQ
jgi:hypothetical protein